MISLTEALAAAALATAPFCSTEVDIWSVMAVSDALNPSAMGYVEMATEHIDKPIDYGIPQIYIPEQEIPIESRYNTMPAVLPKETSIKRKNTVAQKI